MHEILATQSMAHRPAAAASPESWLEMQNQTPPQTCGTRICILTSSPTWFRCTAKGWLERVSDSHQLLHSVSLMLTGKWLSLEELEAQFLEKRPGFGMSLVFGEGF